MVEDSHSTPTAAPGDNSMESPAMIRSLFLLFVPFLLSLAGCGGPMEGIKSRVAREAEARDGDPAGANAAAKAEQPRPQAVKRKIIYTGFVDLIVDNFEQAEQQLQDLVQENQGYIDKSEMTNTPGQPRSGVWTVRVPTTNFDSFVQAAMKFGEVRHRTTNSQDITDAYYDSAARLKADETEEKSLLNLLEQTHGKVEDILKVREQLRVVRGQIEQRKSQLQRWDKDTELATVTVNLLDRRDYKPPIAPNFTSSIGQTFQGSIEALAAFGRGVVLVVVALTPWLVVLAVLGLPIAIFWRRRRRVSNAVVVEAVHPEG
jgi:hypothetical protein